MTHVRVTHTRKESFSSDAGIQRDFNQKHCMCRCFDVVIPPWDLKKHQGREDTRTLGFNGWSVRLLFLKGNLLLYMKHCLHSYLYHLLVSVFHLCSLPWEDFLALAALCLFYRREAERRHQTVDELAKLSALQEKMVTHCTRQEASRRSKCSSVPTG